jgi:6-phosphofructokinase 1
MPIEAPNTLITSLGECRIPSPVSKRGQGTHSISFVSDEDRILIEVNVNRACLGPAGSAPPPSYELAGPRSQIFFDPSKLKCALVMCGGICPGLNDLIRSIVLELHYGYGVRNIFGVRYGLRGFIARYGYDFMDLTPKAVLNIHERGGTLIGSSRGPQDIEEIVDTLERTGIGILFMIGGDGTLQAATSIADAALARGLRISVVGLPKTIDNDIFLVSRSFGFDTAVDVSTRAIVSASNEAEGYPNGIGLIKLMGRHSGFIAATATLAQQDVNYVLIPEVDFDLDGPNGLLRSLETRLAERGHAVIVAAEGAGQKFFDHENKELDLSGQCQRPGLLQFPRPQRSACRDGREDRSSDRELEQPLRARAHEAAGGQAQACRSPRHALAQRSGGHRSGVSQEWARGAPGIQPRRRDTDSVHIDIWADPAPR